MAISSLGIGSGIDIGSLVSQLVAAQIQPQAVRLDRKEAGIQARLSGFSALKGALSSFNSSLSNLQSVANFETKKATTSDSDILTVSSSTSALSGNYDVTTTQLASAHKLATDPTLGNAQFTATTDMLTTGTLTFKFGVTDYVKGTDTYNSFTQNAEKASKDVIITDPSLQGIRDAVNNADIGVSSSIVFDGSHYRLAFVADTGAGSSLEITISDDDSNNTDASGLSLLAFNSSATHLEQTGAAQDSIASVNGITVTSEKTSFTNVIEGVTLNILKTGSASVSIDSDKASVNSAITSFVSSYNSLINTINELSSYDADTGQSGVLNGDGILRSIDTQIKRLLGDSVTGIDGPFSILADIGISRDPSDGSMKINQTKLDSAIDDNLDNIVTLFAAYGKVNDPLVSFDTSTADTNIGEYSVNITQLSTQGNLLGSSAANLTISAGVNDSLDLMVDGLSASITLTAGTYTAASLLAELQAKINGASEYSISNVAVKVSESGGIFTLTSNRYGSASNVEITGGNGKTDLIGAIPTKTDGLDVTGTIGGTTAVGSGQYLTGVGDSSGLKLLIEGTTTGDRGVVNFTRGFADQLDSLLSTMLGTENIFDSVDKSLNDSVDRINDQRNILDARAESIQKRLLAQFTAMDSLVSRLQTTGSYLTQQLANISKISTNNN